MKSLLCLVMVFAGMMLEGNEVVIRAPDGKLHVVNVGAEDNFLNTMEILQSSYGTQGEFLVDFMAFTASSSSKNGSSSMRNYANPVTSAEKKEISYIVNTLGMESLTKVAKSKSSLKKSGKVIENIHPLRFLMTIFTDDKMKASIGAMRSRSWIWSEFFGGIKNTMEEESNRDNMQDSFVIDFAAHLGLDPNLISPYVSQRDWNGLINALITHVPRNGNSGRYNM